VRRAVAIAFLSMVFGAAGMLCIAWAFVSLTRNEYLSALVVSAFAVFTFGMIAMMSIVSARRVTARVEYDDAGTTFRPDRKVDGLLMVSTIAAFVAMVLYSVFTPIGMLNIPVPPGNRRYLVFACVAGVLVGVFSLRQIIRQRGMSHLRLTAYGVETGSALSSTDRSWEDVSAVADRPPNGRHTKKSGTTYITTADGRTRTLPSDWYTPGGDALRKLVRIYWQHPEYRDELTDGRAVERLRTGFWP
jgi:hypothetical protein